MSGWILNKCSPSLCGYGPTETLCSLHDHCDRCLLDTWTTCTQRSRDLKLSHAFVIFNNGQYNYVNNSPLLSVCLSVSVSVCLSVCLSVSPHSSPPPPPPISLSPSVSLNLSSPPPSSLPPPPYSFSPLATDFKAQDVSSLNCRLFHTMFDV